MINHERVCEILETHFRDKYELLYVSEENDNRISLRTYDDIKFEELENLSRTFHTKRINIEIEEFCAAPGQERASESCIITIQPGEEQEKKSEDRKNRRIYRESCHSDVIILGEPNPKEEHRQWVEAKERIYQDWLKKREEQKKEKENE